MAHFMETPSRILRRIEARTGSGREMPSLPSLPGFEDSMALEPQYENSDETSLALSDASAPLTSTPTTTLLSNIRSTVHGRPHGRAPGSANSTTRFANSVTSRSTRSGKSSAHNSTGFSAGRRSVQASFNDVSLIAPAREDERSIELSIEDELDLPSMRGMHSMRAPSMPPDFLDEGGLSGDEGSLANALESVSSRASTPPIESDDLPEPDLDIEPTPRKNKSYDYSMSIRSAPKVRFVFLAAQTAQAHILVSIHPSTNTAMSPGASLLPLHALVPLHSVATRPLPNRLPATPLLAAQLPSRQPFVLLQRPLCQPPPCLFLAVQPLLLRYPSSDGPRLTQANG
jgi:hypothetical protein